MSHYKNGESATVGDIVRGWGYNVPYQIVGVVVGIEPGATSCNLRVAHAKALDTGTRGAPHVIPVIEVEYGEAAAFEKVTPRSG